MKLEYLGFNAKTGYHDRRLTRAESRFVGILWTDHEGEKNAIPSDLLAIRYVRNCSHADAKQYRKAHEQTHQNAINKWKRDVRHMHNHLLQFHSNIPILSKAGAGGGYWNAETETEAADFYESFRRRGLTGLVKASRGKQAALVDMVQQLSFEFEELADQTGFSGRMKPKAEVPTPIEVVDAFLERMLMNPEKFADGLRKIGKKYGSVLLPREQVTAMKEKADELQRLVASLNA